jgi:hypothetical protein
MNPELAQNLEFLKLQNWILVAAVVIVGGGLFYMIRVAWAELKTSNQKNTEQLGEHAIALGVLMERHETSRAIANAGSEISDAIKHNADRMISTLQAITPPSRRDR